MAQRIDVSGIVSTGEPYRLTAGERLVIQLGPIRVDGTDWYSVRPAADSFGADMGALDFGEGWLPAGEGGTSNLRESVARDPSCCLSAAGMEGVTTVEVPASSCGSASSCQPLLTWAAATGDPDDTCDLQITLDATGAVIVDGRVRGWTGGEELWGEQGAAALTIETDCSWSLHIGAA